MHNTLHENYYNIEIKKDIYYKHDHKQNQVQ